jgi:3-hydroxyisobutyrate dehydrogenase-like beta-hydroxyacid dehydrogenase
MGAAMVRRLAAAGRDVVVWNRNATAARALADDVAAQAAGTVEVAASPADAVALAAVCVAVLANGDVTRAVLLDPDVLAALPARAVVADHGTSGQLCALELNAALTAAGARFVDAPVSGSVATVEAGQLLVMAAGPPDAVDALEPLVAAYAKGVARLGEPGAGQAMKLAVNLVVYDLNAALAEALVLATRAGIPAAAAYDVLASSAVAAPFVQYKRAAFLADDDPPVAMSLDLVAKDLSLVTGLAERLGVEVTATRAVAGAVDAARAAGYGPADMAVLRRYVEQRGTPS